MTCRAGWPATTMAVVLILMACSSAPSPLPSGLATVAPTSAATPSASSSPPTSSAQTATPTAATFPGPTEAWASLTWQKLTVDDRLASFQSVVRTAVGFIALGAPKSTQSGFRTPVSISSEAATWEDLNPTAVGADAIVVGIYGLSGTLVAVTMAGGAAPCEDTADLCPQLRPPLNIWTSADGRTWTFRTQPLDLAVAPDTGLLEDVPQSAASHGRLLVTQGGTSIRMAASTDGLAWDTVTPTGLPPGFRGSLAGAAGGGFVLAGSVGGDNSKPELGWSSDGRSWETAALPISPRTVGGAGPFAAGRDGLIVAVTTDVTPGGPSWWASTDGRDWLPIKQFAPLGVWNGEGEGSGLLPNGVLVADGARMVAYDTVTGTRAWTSFDGTTWAALQIAGDRPPATNGFPQTSASQLTLSEIGLFWRDDQGNVWLGQPR